MLAFLRRRAIPGIERVTADLYARSVQLDGVQGTIAVEAADGNTLRATVRFPKLSALPSIIARLRRVFDLAADPVAIAAHLAKDPALAPLVKARPGLRVPGAWDGFELAIRAVLGQQITVSAAVRLTGRLVATHGERLAEPDGDLTHVFPRAEALAAADLTSLGMPRSRAAALSAMGAAALANTHRISSTRQAGSTTPSGGCGQFAVSGNGRRIISLCASCANRTPFLLPISVSCARSPVWNDASIPYPNFLIEPMCGGLGAPTLHNTYGPWPERRYCAGAWQAYSFSVTPCCRMFKRHFVSLVPLRRRPSCMGRFVCEDRRCA